MKVRLKPMQLIRDQETPIKTRGINHRVGTFRYKELGEGEPGTPGNYNLRMVWSQTDFFSPRHRHNFDQVRVQITGTFSFDDDGVMRPGVVGYFPEGTQYGPQTSQMDTCTLVLQIGGPSGNGYLSEAARVAAVEQLAKTGRFEGGRYFSHEVPGDGADRGPGVDAFLAAWEMAHGRTMMYPPERMARPLLLHEDSIDWAAWPGVSGARRKRLWNLGAQTVGLEIYRLEAGAQLPLSGPATCFVQQGEGAVQEGSCGTGLGRFNEQDTLHVGQGEIATLTADEVARILVFTHPVFSV